MQKRKDEKVITGGIAVRFFRASHTYIGIVLAPLLILLGGTGIILNHTASFGQHPLTAKIHAGLILGGPILIDIAGAVLIYLSLTGIYIWAYARKMKKKSSSTKAQNVEKKSA